VYKKRFDREWNDQMELFSNIKPPIVDGDGACDALADLQAVMWDCDDLLVVLFDYYASLNSDGRISSLTFNEWGMFLEDFKLVDPSTESSTRGDLDRIFISVDVKASKLAKEAAQAAAKAGRKAGPDLDEKKALKRVEFLSALVQVRTQRPPNPVMMGRTSREDDEKVGPE
jgi:hypothetical protein